MVGQPVHGLMTMAVQIFLYFFYEYKYICSDDTITFVFGVCDSMVIGKKPLQNLVEAPMKMTLVFCYLLIIFLGYKMQELGLCHCELEPCAM